MPKLAQQRATGTTVSREANSPRWKTVVDRRCSGRIGKSFVTIIQEGLVTGSFGRLTALAFAAHECSSFASSVLYLLLFVPVLLCCRQVHALVTELHALDCTSTPYLQSERQYCSANPISGLNICLGCSLWAPNNHA